MNAVVKAELDKIWLALAELRQSKASVQLAPAPDYRGDLPADEPCSCEESERLKAELGEAHVRIQELESNRDTFLSGHVASLESKLAAANALLERVRFWSNAGHLTPHQRWERIAGELSSQPAAPECNHSGYAYGIRDERGRLVEARPAAPTDHDRAVLGAVETVERSSLEYYAETFGAETGWGAVSAAELARREAHSKKETP